MMRSDGPRPRNWWTFGSVASLVLLAGSILLVAKRESLLSAIHRPRAESAFFGSPVTSSSSSRRRRLEGEEETTTGAAAAVTTAKIKVYYDATAESSVLFRKFQQEIDAAEPLIEAIPLDVSKPTACPPGPTERIQELLRDDQYHLALEVLKYCAIAHGGGSGLFIDADHSVLVDTLAQLLQGYGGKNMAVLNDPFLPSSIHGGILFFHPNHSVTNIVMAQQMLEILVSTKLDALVSNPTLLPKSLYDLLAAESSNLSDLAVGPSDRWYILQHICTVEPLGGRQATAPISAFALQSYRYVPSATSWYFAVHYRLHKLTLSPRLPFIISPV